MTAKPHFEIVDESLPPPVPEDSKRDHQAALRMIMLGLSALGQRTVQALADCFTLITVGSAFWLFTSIPDPGNNQLVALFGYCLFVLLANAIVRWKR